MNNWIPVSEELPPSDGWYEVTNSPEKANTSNFLEDHFVNLSLCEYDGIGFLRGGIYVDPKFWRFRRKAVKRYGKISPDKTTA